MRLPRFLLSPFRPGLIATAIALTLIAVPAAAAITDPRAVVEAERWPRPAYLEVLEDRQFQTTVRRICADADATIAIGGKWGPDARHHYSKDQPESDDGLYVWVEQRGTTPTKIILRTSDWAPVTANRGTSPRSRVLDRCTEVRWIPNTGHLMAGFDKAIRAVLVFDPITDELLRVIPVALGPAGEPGLISEGTLADRGDRLVISTHYPRPLVSGARDSMVVVELQRGLCGPAFQVPPGLPGTYDGEIGNVQIDPTGSWVVWKQRGTPEYFWRARVLDDLSIELVPMHADGLQVHAARGNPSARHGGFALSHADVAIAMDGEPVVVGGLRDQDHSNTCSSTAKADSGRVVMVYLASGRHVHVSPGRAFTGSAEASDQHTSARCYRKRGWALVTYEADPTGTKQFADELVLVALDGSRRVIRYGVTRTDDATYRGEAHGVPSPDGRRAYYASNWLFACSACGPAASDVKTYVITTELPPVVLDAGGAAEVAAGRPRILGPTVFTGARAELEVELPHRGALEVDVFALNGSRRRVLEGVHGPGRVRVGWDVGGCPPGVYFVRARLDGWGVARRLAVLR